MSIQINEQPTTQDTATAHADPLVRRAIPDDWSRLAVAMAKAYYDDPVWSHLLPGEKRRLTSLQRFFEIEARRVILPHESSWTTDDVVGGLLVAPPGKWRISPVTMVARGPAFIRALGKDLVRSLRTLALIERKHPREDHYYIAYAGVVPEEQSHGVGAKLLSPYIERCDREGTPGYLEATSERGAAFYERQGFELMERIELKNGPPLWLMWREPASDGLPKEKA
jgi:GNAT superfamily N-acetyltransferase